MKYTFDFFLRKEEMVNDSLYPRGFKLTIEAEDDKKARDFTEDLLPSRYWGKIVLVEEK